MRVISTLEEFEEFVSDYGEEIRGRLRGESDGWNQKITAINYIMERDNWEESEDFQEGINNQWYSQYEEIINNI